MVTPVWFQGPPAGSGASAVAFAREGAKVVVADLESQRAGAEETVALIEKAGGTAIFVPTDITDEHSVANLIATTVKKFGGLDFAHNNAGVLKTGFIDQMTKRDFEFVLNVDVVGVFLALKHELKYMKKNGGGAIVNTASDAALTGTPQAEAYVAAKHAVVGLTKVAAA